MARVKTSCLSHLKHLIFLCYIANCKIKQKEEDLSVRDIAEIGERGRRPWAKWAWLFPFFVGKIVLTIITGQLYNLAPLQMRGHPRPSAEVAASGGKFTLGEKSAISCLCPRSHLAGIKWRIGCIIDDTPSLINRMSQHTQPHLGSVTSEVVVCPRGNLHALKISVC